MPANSRHILIRSGIVESNSSIPLCKIPIFITISFEEFSERILNTLFRQRHTSIEGMFLDLNLNALQAYGRSFSHVILKWIHFFTINRHYIKNVLIKCKITQKEEKHIVIPAYLSLHVASDENPSGVTSNKVRGHIF